MVCVFAVAARAGTITVTNANDSGPGSLRQALADANDGDTIDFAVSGTIGLTSGELLVDKSISVSGPGADNLSVDGNANSRVFHIGSDTTVAIAGLTIANGRVFGFPDDIGAGIYSDHATITVSDCMITSNSADRSGGGIYNDHGTLTVNDCMVSGNFADNTGGAIYHDGSNGTASGQISNCTFVDNTSFSGGAIFSDGNSGTATLVITDTILSGNSVIETGGGISNGHAEVTLENCTISFNTAGGNGGGGIYNFGNTFNSKKGAAVVKISNSTLNGNSSQINGGAIYSDGVAGGIAHVTIVNSTLSGNSALKNGGAIYNSGGFGNATLQIGNTTFADNSAQASGGIVYNFGFFGSDATTELMNTILAMGTAGGTISNNAGTITSQGYNLSSDDASGFLNGPGDQINTDPLLGALRDNGGPTFTHALLKGSPAINAGDPNFTPPPVFDQRGQGFDRIVNGRLDIGSFEVQGTTPTPTPTATPSPTSTPTVTPTPTATPRVTPTPRPRPSPHPRPTPR